MKRRPFLGGRFLLAAFSLLLAVPPSALASSRTLPAAEIPLALRRLSVVGNVLYIAAHPDDENTAMLAYLTNERLVRTGYLSLTRGDGGQNLIGREQGELTGVIRTQELLAARRIDGAEQFFTRAVDFGYSKSPEETLSIWGQEEILGDVVRVIRAFRPEVIITRFPTTGEGGHGHHTASALLAGLAFDAAGDPSRFPEQLGPGGLSVWQPRRLYWNAFRIRPEERDPKLPKLLTVDLGAYNALLGRSYTELAGESRTQHKSQGFGSPERRGTLVNYLAPIKGDPVEKDFLERIDLSWKRIKGGESVQRMIDRAAELYRPETPQAIVPLLIRLHAEMKKLPADPWVEQKRTEVLDMIRSASGLWVEALATRPSSFPGGSAPVTATVIGRAPFPWTVEAVEVDGQRPSPASGKFPSALSPNQPLRFEAVMKIPENAEITHPYWLGKRSERGRFAIPPGKDPLRADNKPVFTAKFTLRAGSDPVTFEVPVEYRWTDPVHGDRSRPFEILPKATLHVEDRVILFPEPKSRTVHVSVRAGKDEVKGLVHLRVPSGFKTTGPVAFSLATEGEEKRLSFEVTPSDLASAGTIRAEAEVDGRMFSHDFIQIDYPHIPVQTLTPPAEAAAVRIGVQVNGKSAGYIMGSGDEIPEALRQLGFRVSLLSDEDLAGDLSPFDVIVTGVRAYNTRPRLRGLQKRLMEYVENGGTLVVQYNTSHELVTDALGPYPFKLSRDRVTHEDAPVRFVNPDHPLVQKPNILTPADFDGWVQERGLYFPGSWDSQYETVFSCADPGEDARPGGLILARYGKGVFIYTGYAWFRQLPAGVPGAYRVFANLVSARGNQ